MPQTAISTPKFIGTLCLFQLRYYITHVACDMSIRAGSSRPSRASVRRCRKVHAKKKEIGGKKSWRVRWKVTANGKRLSGGERGREREKR